MAALAVITPSYAPDFELCRDLNASMLAHTPASTTHYIIVPHRDVGLFRSLLGPRTIVWSVDQLMPRYFVGLDRLNLWVNLRRPFPPVRGWVMQQAVELHAAAQIEADVLLSPRSTRMSCSSARSRRRRFSGMAASASTARRRASTRASPAI